MVTKRIQMEGDYLHLPVTPGAPRAELALGTGGEPLYYFAVELAEEPEHYFFLHLPELRGRELEITAQLPEGTGTGVLDRIFSGGEPEGMAEYKGMYRERLRPQVHFSSRRGWLNDPNGLYWHEGWYHLFYQHDPLGTLHRGANISWGHAVSKDLLHWEERGDAILPWRRDWLIASGSALVDSRGVAGEGKDAVVAAFTCLGAVDLEGNVAPSGGQFLAVSSDGGKTFRRVGDSAAIGVPEGADWRDPRLFEEGGRYYIAVYERREEVNGVSFYGSANLLDWELHSWTPDLFECPDLFRLTVAEIGEEKWVLYGADGLARLGDFREGTFTDGGIHFPLDYGTSTYAGQTWNHEPRGRRVHISWVRGLGEEAQWEHNMGYHGMPFSQCMSIPCEITLRRDGERYHLCRYPVAEVEPLRKGKAKEERFALVQGEEAVLSLEAPSDTLLEYEAEGEPLTVAVGGCAVTVDPARELFQAEGKPPRVLLERAARVRILLDRTTVEIFVNEEASATYALDTGDAPVRLKGWGRVSLRTWAMESVWK